MKIIFRLHLLLQAVPIGVIQEELTSEIRSLQAVQLALGNGKAQNQQFSPIYAPFSVLDRPGKQIEAARYVVEQFRSAPCLAMASPPSPSMLTPV